MPLFFAWHDKVTGEFIHTTIVPFGKFQSTGSGDSGFGFKYALDDPDGKGFEIGYQHAGEQWHFKSSAPKKSKIDGQPHELDVTATVKASGYIPSAYWGLESIGFQKLYNQNPETMYGLTYYYTAPDMEMKGSVTLADGVHDRGSGMVRTSVGQLSQHEQARYFWGYARFQNGDTITWRQYYGNPVGKLHVEVPFDTVAARKGWAGRTASRGQPVCLYPQGASASVFIWAVVPVYSAQMVEISAIRSGIPVVG